MKIAIISDIHFDVRNGNQFFLDKYNIFFEKQFFPYLKDNNITTLLIGGDTWENRKKIGVNSMFHAKNMFFDKLLENNIKTYSILGNHDVSFKNTNEVHSLDILESAYNNFELIYDNKVINFDGADIAFCSWINNENYLSQLDFIKNNNADFLLGHFEINNFEMTKGHLCEDGLNQDLFKKYTQVWSGHFHIRSKSGNITYVGNPFQTNKGDIGYERGFHIFDTTSKQLSFIKNEYNIYERIFFKNDLDIEKFDYEYYTNKIVIVNIDNMLDVNIDLLNKFIDKLNNVSHIVEVEESKVIDVTTGEVQDIDLKTHNEIINEYIDNIFTDDKNLNVKRILSERYNECLQENMNG